MDPCEKIVESVTAEPLQPWVVLNVDGRDAALDFSSAGCDPDLSAHPPVNYHAYAACTSGSFQKSVSAVASDAKHVLVLLRRRNLVAARAAVRQLLDRSLNVWVSLKESGGLQVAELISDARRWQEFCDVCSLATGCLSSTPDMVPLYRAAGGKQAVFVPTPYPVDLPAWDFSRPVSERSGIFIGTREFDVASRRHTMGVVTACMVAKNAGVRVVVMNPDGRGGQKMLDGIRTSMGAAAQLEVVPGPLAYPEYLRLMASCRLVWQLDRSSVPGQVAGDALLARVPCVGGDGAIDRLGHPSTHGDGRSADELIEVMQRLLKDDAFYNRVCEESAASARNTLSFSAIADRLSQLSARAE